MAVDSMASAVIADSALISRNTVVNALNGIVIYGADLPADVRNSVISNNNVLSSLGNTQAITKGISITGASNITVTGNTVNLAPGEWRYRRGLVDISERPCESLFVGTDRDE